MHVLFTCHSDGSRARHALGKATVLSNIERRFLENDIYTFTGNILLAVNPYERLPIYDEKAMAGFPNNALRKNQPHVFATSEEAYQRINKDRRSQSIVVSGESGAGKTETNKCGPAQRSPYPQGWPASLSLIR